MNIETFIDISLTMGTFNDPDILRPVASLFSWRQVWHGCGKQTSKPYDLFFAR